MKNVMYISFLVVILYSCGNKQNEGTEESEATENDTSSVVVETPVSKYIECFGVVDVPPNQIFEIYAKANGYIADVKVLEGQHVNKGETLLEIESPDFAILQKEYKSAKANFDWHKLNVERNRILFSNKAISEKEIQTIEKEFEIAQANYMGLREQIKAIGFDSEKVLSSISNKLNITSKIHGVVVILNAKNGSRVSSENHLLTVIDKSHIHMEMKISANDIQKIQLNQAFFILHNSDTIRGKIHLINDIVNDDNTVRVHGHFDQAADEKKLIVGQNYFVNIIP